MDHFRYLIDRQHRLLLIGILLLLLAVAFVISGETLMPYARGVDQSADPKRFWRQVLGYLVVAFSFIALQLYQNSR